MSDYWKEAVENTLEEVGLIATEQQIDDIANSMEVYHENYGMAHGHHSIPNPLKVENDELRRKLHEEQAKILCKECDGRGSITVHGPIHSGTSQCWKCRGKGRYAP